MALKAVHVSDVPNLDHVPENSSSSVAVYHPSRFPKGSVEVGRAAKFLVIGHRGSGMNLLQSTDRRMKAIRENSILSFNTASNYAVDYVEFDVQVTKDGFPIIFHDNFILSEEEDGMILERRVTDLSLSEFLDYGFQRETGRLGRSLLRKTKDGRIVGWNVETDDSLCTLEDAFHKVDPRLGFNIELKFDDDIIYPGDQLVQVLQDILRVVFEHARDRPIIFSSFQPDAILLIRKLQSTYPVFFLTNAGTEVYHDARRNSLEEAIKLCLEGGLQGIVSAVKGVFRNPGAVNKIKESKLSLLTYGNLNNVPEAVYMQHLMGIDGVIIDLVEKITEAVSNLKRLPKEEEGVLQLEEEEKIQHAKPQFTQRELSFLMKLIPELVKQ